MHFDGKPRILCHFYCRIDELLEAAIGGHATAHIRDYTSAAICSRCFLF
jgi:hypothetical protein